jgi:hypothetical protein
MIQEDIAMAASADTHDTNGTRSLPQTLALVFGAVYLLVGIIGFFWTGFHNFAGTASHDMILGIFMVNPLHNIAHILVGVLGLTLGRTLAGARTFGWALAVLYAALFVYVLVAVGKSWDFSTLRTTVCTS